MKETTSSKQLAANQANAQKSTGPKTPEGRAVSKMNALKHGIFSKEVLVSGLNIKESRRELEELMSVSGRRKIRPGRWRKCWWTK